MARGPGRGAPSGGGWAPLLSLSDGGPFGTPAEPTRAPCPRPQRPPLVGSLVPLVLTSSRGNKLRGGIVRHEFSADGQLLTSKLQDFFGFSRANARDFEQDLPREDRTNSKLDTTLTFTHTGFSRFLCNRFVGKSTNPNLPYFSDSSYNYSTDSLHL